MSFREAAKRIRAGAVVAIGSLALLAGCGEDDFENEPRPPKPIDITAAISDRDVTVSPSEFGAGLVTITVSNQATRPARLVLEGPQEATSAEMQPGGTASIKLVMDEGEYEASAGDRLDARPDKITVGPPRETSSNELLLP